MTRSRRKSLKLTNYAGATNAQEHPNDGQFRVLRNLWGSKKDTLEPFAIALDKEKWSLVQPLLSSSYSGYGTSSLKQILDEKLGRRHGKVVRGMGKAQVIALTEEVDTLKDKIAAHEVAWDAGEALIDEKMSMILRALQMSNLQIPMPALDLAPPLTFQPFCPADTQ
ncbi:hypothetical protein DVH24_026712 [Malus domestica]|uniref:Uncharacterized protein n=1 Tax=Malus domestica TaxID=3750 RepID=A0A498K9T6_MALDO|nr:hypothetical protein DVH24_026712 [Malus domestica]